MHLEPAQYLKALLTTAVPGWDDDAESKALIDSLGTVLNEMKQEQDSVNRAFNERLLKCKTY